MLYKCTRISISENVDVVDVEESQMPFGLKNVLEEYEFCLTNFLLRFQEGKTGFRVLGGEIGANNDLNDVGLQNLIKGFNPDCNILRATENKRSISHLIINKWLKLMQEGDLVLVMYSKPDIGKYILDGSQIQSNDVVKSFKSLINYCSLKKKGWVYIVEIQGFSDYSFKETFSDGNKSYYKLIEKM